MRNEASIWTCSGGNFSIPGKRRYTAAENSRYPSVQSIAALKVADKNLDRLYRKIPVRQMIYRFSEHLRSSHSTFTKGNATIMPKNWTIHVPKPFEHTYYAENSEFIALKEKGSTNAVSIYFFWRDTDKIKSAKHDRHEVTGFWRWSRKMRIDWAL